METPATSFQLHAISPCDGRYADKTAPLREYFSERALIRYRLRVEIEYFTALCGFGIPALTAFPKEKFEDLRNLYRNFSDADALEIKEIEKPSDEYVYPPDDSFVTTSTVL